MSEKEIAVYAAMSELIGSVTTFCDSVKDYMEESSSRVQRLEGEVRHATDEADRTKKLLKRIGQAITEELNEY